MSGVLRELILPGRSPVDLQDLQTRSEHGRGVAAWDLSHVQDPVREQQVLDNVITLGAGRHGGGRLTEAFTRLMGVGGAEVVRQLAIDTTCEISGIHFISSSTDGKRNNRDALVTVSATSVVVFNNCTFTKDAGDPMSAAAADRQCYVVIERDGKATFQGCTFKGTPAAGLVVNNLGGPAEVLIVGCSNQTGSPHGGVTLVAEV